MCKIYKNPIEGDGGEQLLPQADGGKQKRERDMNRENKEIVDALRREVRQLQSDRLVKLESE